MGKTNKIILPILTFTTLLMITGCTTEKSHVFCNANNCRLSLNQYGSGFYFSGTLINDSKRDASNIILYVYFKNIYGQEYSIPSVYTTNFIAKNSQEQFSFKVDYSTITTWRLELNWIDA